MGKPGSRWRCSARLQLPRSHGADQDQGADDAWMRLQAILNWFVEVEAEGGYRAYYEKPGRGLLQGGGPPGGLGMDKSFWKVFSFRK